MIGQILGGYKIHERIGSGGMATVYKAKDPLLDRFVAIKILPHHYINNEAFRTRFEREARAITSLEHAHILPVYKHGEEDGIAYIAMRYVRGGTLKDWLGHRQIPFAQTHRIIRQIASALDFAHEYGILHRDVKPSNVLIHSTENTYLSDFGLAKILEDSSTGLTGQEFLGTPRYMSPEQCSDVREIEAASDQYSLGVILYQMVTGQTPYEVSTPVGIVKKHTLKAPFARPRQLRRDLSLQADGVIQKALAHDPLDRFRSCSEMADAFKRAIDEKFVMPAPYRDVGTSGPVPWEEPIVTPPPLETPKKRPLWMWIAVLCIVIGFGAGIGVLAGTLATRNNPSSGDRDRGVSSGGAPDSSSQNAMPTVAEIQVATLPPSATLAIFPSPTLPDIATPTPLSIPTATPFTVPTEVRIPTLPPTFTFTPSREQSDTCLQHIVVAGETLFGIAVQYGVLVDDLLELNGLPDNPVLSIGDTLWLPSDTCRELPPYAELPIVDQNAILQTATALANRSLPATATATSRPTATLTSSPTKTATPSSTATATSISTATLVSTVISSSIKISVRNPGDIDLEGVGITNQGGRRDVTGWQLVDEDGHTFLFPSMQLSSGASLTIYSRAGQNTPAALYWNQGESIWQAGEFGTLFDADGNTVVTFVVGAE